MKLSTRIRIMDILRREHVASVKMLADSLGMTQANIYHHLSVLEANERVQVAGQRRGKKGRSQNIYGLSGQVLGDSLGYLAGALMDEWLADLCSDEREMSLMSLSERLAAEASYPEKGTLLNRLAYAIKYMNKLHYLARWEAGVSGARIVLNHCPYYSILEKHPEMCRVDSYLLQRLTGHPVLQTLKLESIEPGMRQCQFQIQ